MHKNATKSGKSIDRGICKVIGTVWTTKIEEKHFWSKLICEKSGEMSVSSKTFEGKNPGKRVFDQGEKSGNLPMLFWPPCIEQILNAARK